MFLQLSPEERTFRDLAALQASIAAAIYRPVADLKAEAWVTKEPVPFAARDQGRYLSPGVGESWGHLWDCAWFHFTGKVPEQAASHEVALLIDLSGEGCVVDSAGTPLLGLTTLSSEFDRTLG
jgi:alpha-mannosidase